MASYVAATVQLYRLIGLFSGDRRWSAVAGAMVFAVNVNVLYQQSTSMDELPFYAFTVAAVYYLVKWGETRRSTNLLAASVSSMLAMLCRYEGWFVYDGTKESGRDQSRPYSGTQSRAVDDIEADSLVLSDV